MSEEIELHGWLGKKKGAVFQPQVFFSGIALNTKYQGSRHSGFSQEGSFFYVFPI